MTQVNDTIIADGSRCSELIHDRVSSMCKRPMDKGCAKQHSYVPLKAFATLST